MKYRISGVWIASLVMGLGAFHSLKAQAESFEYEKPQAASFWREGFKKFSQVGTVFEVSHATGRALMKEALANLKRKDNQLLRVLEIGAGTGSVSAMIIQALKERGLRYRLDLVEIDSVFCQELKVRFKGETEVEVVCQDFLDFGGDPRSYDLIVSTLPFNSKFFNESSTRDIFRKVEHLLKTQGIFSFVSYVGTAPLSRFVYRFTTPEDEYESLLRKYDYLDSFTQEHALSRMIVYQNMPPIWVNTCRFKQSRLP